MPENNPWRGRVVRDPALRGEVVGREARAGEFELIGEKRGDWTDGQPVIPSAAKARQIQSALKSALLQQLEGEAAALGNLDVAAIHGKTGISTLEDQIAINPVDGG